VRDVGEPNVADGEVLVDLVRVGLCGTDARMERGSTASTGSAIPPR
jgi:threonine dehydrogenase-like Zn-dependent dehydrogenase